MSSVVLTLFLAASLIILFDKILNGLENRKLITWKQKYNVSSLTPILAWAISYFVLFIIFIVLVGLSQE